MFTGEFKVSYINYQKQMTIAPKQSEAIQLRNLNWLIKLFPKVTDILIIGCGNGLEALFLKEKGYSITAMDIDITAFKELEAKGIKTICYDAEKQDYPMNEHFDIVLCINVIEHLHYPNVLLSEAYRLLKKGGKVFIGTVDYNKTNKDWFWDMPTHYTPITSKSLEGYLLINNFTNIAVKSYGQMAFPFAGLLGFWRLIPMETSKDYIVGIGYK